MRCRGVVLIDVVMMLAVLGIVVLALMPSANPGASMRLVAASAILASDLEFAQSASLSRPADPTVVRFDSEGCRYWLSLVSDPETPILRPGGVEPYEVEFGYGSYRELWGVTLEVEGMADGSLVFDAMGRLVSSVDGVIRLGNGHGELAVVVRATTGSVSVLEGSQVARMPVLGEEEEPPGMDVDGPTEPEAPAPEPTEPPKKGGLLGLGILGL